jgi:arylsulfatase A-like enzyme
VRGVWIALLLVAVALAGSDRPTSDSPSFLLLSLDTFRADRLAAWGGTRGVTPNLDAFAAHSVVFTKAWSQASTTSPSHAALFTSRYPSELHGPTRAPALDDKHTLAEVLGLYGYQTGARVAGGDLAPVIGPRKGFETYKTTQDFGSMFHAVPAGLEWLDARDKNRPFFLFLHSYDTHAVTYKPTPYGLLYARTGDLAESQARLLMSTERVFNDHLHEDLSIVDAVTSDTLLPWDANRARVAEAAAAAHLPVVSLPEQQLVRDAYDGAAAYADAWFGVLLARLQERGLLDTTWIIVLADHGEVLGEGGLFHRCCGLQDAVVNVPLIVRPPGGIEGRVVDQFVELIDVMPTMLELAGAAPPAGLRGRSFAAALRGEPFEGRPFAISEGGLSLRLTSIRYPEGRLTWWGVDTTVPQRAELLASTALPGPHFVAEGLDEARTKEGRAELVKWEGTLQRSTQTEGAATPPELAAELRRRGYWDAK